MAKKATKQKRDPVSAYLSQIGRRGGEREVPKGAAMLSAEERRQRAKAMSTARWEQYYRDHPDKLKAKLERQAKKKAAAKKKA